MRITFARAIVLVLVVVPLFESCASIFSGCKDVITVNSLEPGSKIFIDGSLRGVDTASADVKRGKRHQIKVEKDGYQSVTVETSESFDALSLLGILIDFGIITIPLDLLMGGAWKQDPTIYTVTPIALKAAPAAVASKPMP